MDYNHYSNVPLQGIAQEASNENQTTPEYNALRYSWNSLASGSPGSFSTTGYESGASLVYNHLVGEISTPVAHYVSPYPSNPIHGYDSFSAFGSPEMPDLPEGSEYAPSAPTNIASPGPYIGQSIQQGDLLQEISPAGRERYYCGWKGCTARFKRKGDLARHIQETHFGPKHHSCPFCIRAFNRKDNLSSHIEAVHGSQVKNFLPDSRLQSQVTRNRDCDALFVEWELPSIVQNIPENERAGFLLSSITLTMGEKGVNVMICKELIQAQYGQDGIEFVNFLLLAMASDVGRYANDRFKIQCTRHWVSVAFEPGKSPGNVRGLLVWLCLTFRQPKNDAVCLSTYEMEEQSVALQGLSVVPTDNGRCWLSLFETAVIAMEPYYHQDIAPTLEIDFLLLLQLAAVEYPVLVDGGLVLMGYSTALIPIKRVDDKTILWHLETSHHDSQLRITELSAIKTDWLRAPNFDHLRTEKALVGWCSEAITFLGTGHLNTVHWSGAKTKESTWTLKGANLQFIATSTAPLQLGAQGGLTFNRSINRLRFSASKNYLKCLSSSAKEQIVVYDVGDSRAWLVPLLCVFHEMLLAYWRTIPMQHRQANVPLAAPSPDGATASLAALWGNGGLIIEGCQDDQLTIRDLILGFSSNLSRTMVHRPSRAKIYGYEFMDLMMDSHKSELKKYHVGRQRQSWTRLLEHVNCLFCSNIGDVIRGYKGITQDSPCNQLPKGKNWLAVSMHSLDELNRRNGGDDCTMPVQSRRLSNQQFWELTGSPFQTCEHMKGSAVTCWESSSLFQKVQTRQVGRSGKEVKHKSHFTQQQQQQHSTNGAVVFGRPGKFTPYVYRIFQPSISDYCPKPEAVGSVPSRADSPEPVEGAMAIA